MLRFGMELDLRDGDAVLALAGEVDVAVADMIFERGSASLLGPDRSSLVIDMSRVTFMDAAGLGGLIRLRNLAGDVGATLTIRRPSRAARRLFELTRLTASFAVSPLGTASRPLTEVRTSATPKDEEGDVVAWIASAD